MSVAPLERLYTESTKVLLVHAPPPKFPQLLPTRPVIRQLYFLLSLLPSVYFYSLRSTVSPPRLLRWSSLFLPFLFEPFAVETILLLHSRGEVLPQQTYNWPKKANKLKR